MTWGVNLIRFEYFSFIVFLIFLVVFAIILFGLSYSLIFQDLTSEKVSAYECGFQPFKDARGVFEVRFYLIGILFIIFDLELIFLFPWVYCFNSLGGISLISVGLFFFILILGFIVEWRKGALEWD